MAEYYKIRDDISVSDSCLCFVKKETEVLEIGSGSGNLTKYMQEILQCKVSCIEISPEMAESGKQYATQMIIADVEVDSWETSLNQKFDCIMLADVLEHLRKPSRLINRLLPYLKDDGIIISSIPNIAHNAILMGMYSGKFEYRETGLLDNTHIHFLTRSSIKNLFESNGLYLQKEESKEIRPCDTEFEYYYCKHPIHSLSIISREDAHVYRYIQQWSKNNNQENKETPKKLSFIRRIYELMYDFLCYIKRKKQYKTPKFFYKMFQSGDDLKEKKRYEKFNS